MTRWCTPLLVVALAAVILFPGASHAQANLDPALRRLLAEAERAQAMPEQLAGPVALTWESAQEEPDDAWASARVRVLVKTDCPDDAASLPGFTASRTLVGIATGTAEVPRLRELAAHPSVSYVEASRPLHPHVDLSVPETGAPLLWHGTPTSTGEGVIVGIVDTGLDILHPDFRVDRTGDGSEEGSRVLYLWDQQGYGTVGQAFGLTYGRLYPQRELETYIAIGNSPRLDTHGHGTHVAGIAAGDGSARQGTFTGVAPDADLVIVRTTFYTDTVIDAVGFVFDVAALLGKPAVVNLSLGGHGGPHDGTSLFERALDALLDRPGRAIVAAAGNEGATRIHVGENVRTTTTWDLEIKAQYVPVQFWHDGEAAFRVELASPTGARITADPGEDVSYRTPSGDVFLSNPRGPDPRNEDKQVSLVLSGARSGDTWAVTFTPIGAGGHVDGWVGDPTSAAFRQGDNRSTISEPGNAHRVITVGAHVTKKNWDSLDGPQSTDDYTLGALAPFSSRGPTRDGRTKPDLVAPGAWVAAPLSRDAAPARRVQLPGGHYMILQGTSMSAPHVAGACALLFALNAELTWEDLLEALQSGATTDRFTGSVPNERWGMGKLFIPSAAARIPIAVPQPPAAIELVLATNPVRHTAVFQYRLPEGLSRAELHIYDVAGRRVALRTLSASQGNVMWALDTDWGRAVASGLYLAVVVADTGRSELVRVVVQR